MCDASVRVDLGPCPSVSAFMGVEASVAHCCADFRRWGLWFQGPRLIRLRRQGVLCTPASQRGLIPIHWCLEIARVIDLYTERIRAKGWVSRADAEAVAHKVAAGKRGWRRFLAGAVRLKGRWGQAQAVGRPVQTQSWGVFYASNVVRWAKSKRVPLCAKNRQKSLRCQVAICPEKCCEKLKKCQQPKMPVRP